MFVVFIPGPHRFASLGAMSNPTNTGADYSSVSLPWYATEGITVNASDAAWAAACPGPMAAGCILHIRVRAFRPGNFTLVAVNEATSQRLSPGIPAVRVIPVTNTVFDMVMFEIPISNTAGAPVTPPQFSVDLAVDGLDNPIACVFGTSSLAGPPDPSNSSTWCRPPWVFTTLNVNTFHTYAAGTADTCWCGPGNAIGYTGPCSWYVGVLTVVGLTATVEVVSNYDNAVITQLLDGVPQSVALTSQNDVVYSFSLAGLVGTSPLDATGLRTGVLPLQGDADLYITLDGTTPTTFNFQYSSTRSEGEDWILLDFSDPRFMSFCGNVTAGTPPPNGAGPCTVLIMVNGWSQSCEFMLTASVLNFVQLLPGLPAEGYVTAFPAVARFRIPYFLTTSGLSFALLSLSGQAAFFVSAVNGSAGVPFPSPSNPSTYTWGPIGAGAVLTLPPYVNATTGAPINPGPVPTMFFVTVVSQGIDRSPGSGALFTLTVNIASSTVPSLFLGASVLGSVAGNWAVDRYQLLWWV